MERLNRILAEMETTPSNKVAEKLLPIPEIVRFCSGQDLVKISAALELAAQRAHEHEYIPLAMGCIKRLMFARIRELAHVC